MVLLAAVWVSRPAGSANDAISALALVIFGRFDCQTHLLGNRPADEAPDGVVLMPTSA
jgi:hypothetical protein